MGMEIRAYPGRADWMLAVALWVGLFIGYGLLAQAAITLDGKLGLDRALADPLEANYLHPLFIPVLLVAIKAGLLIGLDAQASGTLLSAFCGASAVALYFLLLRRIGIHALIGLLYALLIAWCNPTLENATSVELYSPMLLALALVFHACWNELATPSRRSAWWLGGACLLLVNLHAACSIVVLFIYLGLCHQRGWRWRSTIQYLLQGSAIAIILGITVIHIYHQHPRHLENSSEFIDLFSNSSEGKSPLMRLLSAPMTDIHLNIGLGLFPAIAGWRMLRRSSPFFGFVIPAVTMVHVMIFSFWIVDVGNF